MSHLGKDNLSEQSDELSLSDKVNKLSKQMDNFKSFMDFMMAGSSSSAEADDYIPNSAEDQREEHDGSSEISEPTSIQEVKSVDNTDSFGQLLQKYETKEKTDKPINEKLAKLVSKMMTTQQSFEEMKIMKDNVLRPENAEFLVSPTVNKEIWDQMSSIVQQKDIRLQKIQTNLVKGIIPLVQEINANQAKSKDNEHLMKSLTLLTNTHMEINNLRRQEIKPELKKLKEITGKSVPITTQLFGDDLESEIKKMEQKEKLSQTVGSKTKSKFQEKRRMHPYNMKQFKERARSFLGQGEGWRKGPDFQTFQTTQKRPFSQQRFQRGKGKRQH